MTRKEYKMMNSIESVYFPGEAAYPELHPEQGMYGNTLKTDIETHTDGHITQTYIRIAGDWFQIGEIKRLVKDAESFHQAIIAKNERDKGTTES